MTRTKRKFQDVDSVGERRKQQIKLYSLPKSEKPAAVEFQALACPFFKKNPRRHWDCASFKTKDAKISHIKQHIYRKHTRPHICPFCGHEFNDPYLRDSHLRVGCSQPKPFLEPDGITMDQRNALNKRPASKLNVESQWYAMFDIIFPGSTRPTSPYNSPVVPECEATHAKFREFIESDHAVEALFMCVLESLGKDLTPGKRAYLREAVRKGLQDLIQVHRRVISEPAASTGPRNNGGESPTSIDSIIPSPSAYFKGDIDPSDMPQPSGGGMSNISSDLPVISPASESWPVFPDLDGSHIKSTVSMNFMQKNSLDSFLTSTATSLSGLDYEVNCPLQQDLASIVPGSGAGFLVPHRGTQAKDVAPDFFKALWMDGPREDE